MKTRSGVPRRRDHPHPEQHASTHKPDYLEHRVGCHSLAERLLGPDGSIPARFGNVSFSDSPTFSPFEGTFFRCSKPLPNTPDSAGCSHFQKYGLSTARKVMRYAGTFIIFPIHVRSMQFQTAAGKVCIITIVRLYVSSAPVITCCSQYE